MSENQKKILQMLAEGKISVSEAERLLSLITSAGNNRSESNSGGTAPKSSPRYLYVVVEPKPGARGHDIPSPDVPPRPPRPGSFGYDRRDWHGKVNVRVPFSLIRAGLKLATLIPKEAADKVNDAMKDKGMSFDMRHLKPEDIEELISALHDSEINVDADDETIRVYAE
jgi:hypothetical protein